MADTIHDLAVTENEFARLKSENYTPEQGLRIADFEQRLEASSRPLKAAMARLSSIGRSEELT
jgi:hypothetical protein